MLVTDRVKRRHNLPFGDRNSFKCTILCLEEDVIGCIFTELSFTHASVPFACLSADFQDPVFVVGQSFSWCVLSGTSFIPLCFPEFTAHMTPI